ncbi:Copia protein, partial [Mucuna pruriens]
MEMTMSMLYEKGMPREFWPEAVNIVVYLLNRCPTKVVWNLTPFEAWSGRKPLVNHLKILGVSISKGYRLYNLKTKKVKDVIFDEKATWNWQAEKVEEKTVSTTILQKKSADKNEQSTPSTPSSSSSLSAPSSSLSSPSSTRKIKSLSDVYVRCNYCVVEPKKEKLGGRVCKKK